MGVCAGSLLQARPAFPTKALPLSGGAMGPGASAWRSGGRSRLFQGTAVWALVPGCSTVSLTGVADKLCDKH